MYSQAQSTKSAVPMGNIIQTLQYFLNDFTANNFSLILIMYTCKSNMEKKNKEFCN